jgi:hypothetical protein
VRRIAVCIVALGSIAACSSSTEPGGVVTITRTRTPSTPPPSPSSKPTPTPSPTKHLTRFPGTCDDLLPDGDVIAALGGKELPGTDAFVVGLPEKDIGRIGYLNCRYGVTGNGAAATPKVEIGVSLYGTPTQASRRIKATVDDYTNHGATSTAVTVDGRPGTLLTGGSGAGYGEPLLVAAAGQRTVAVNLAAAVATGATAAKDATALAALALQRTDG